MVNIGNNLFRAFHHCYTSRPNNADILELVKSYELVSVPSICIPYSLKFSRFSLLKRNFHDKFFEVLKDFQEVPVKDQG